MKKIYKKLSRKIRSLFLNGLLTLLPIAVTVALLNFLFKITTKWLEPIKQLMPLQLRTIPYGELLFTLVGVIVIGAVLKVFLLHPLIHLIERNIVSNIPIVRPIYFGIKQLVQAFTVQDQFTFKKVVLVEFPRRGIYSVGFLTSEFPPEVSPISTYKLFNVYIPTTPNPTTGYFTLVPEKDCIITDLTRQEAMALIISGGIIQPDRFTQKKEL